VSPNLVLDGVQWDRFERRLTCRMAHRNEAGTGVLRVSSRPETRNTSHANDIRRRDGTPTVATPAVG
jgi:hypothetical protein